VADLGLAIIGAVPHMPPGADLADDPHAAAQAIEAFRSLRLNLRHQQPGAGPVQVTITSPGAGEGKSLLASNLALSFAEAGYRTLLIDADVRRGTQHDAFGVTVQPGLTDFLAGSARADEIARRSTHQNLLVIPSGTRFGRGPELLMSQGLSALLGAVKPLFNAIIIDSPPLGAGADALVLGTATGNVMMVIRANETNRKQAESRLQVLRQLPIRLLGAVLNDIPAKGVYEEYGYIDGYDVVDVNPVAPVGVVVATAQPQPE